MNKETALIIIQFLSRASLQGSEVPAFVKAIAELKTAANIVEN